MLSRKESYFVNDSKIKYTEASMLEFLVDNIDIPIGRNCIPLLGDIFLYSYKAEFIELNWIVLVV